MNSSNLKSIGNKELFFRSLLVLLPAMLWLIYVTQITIFNFDTEAAKIVQKTSWQLSFGETSYWYILINLSTLFFPFLLSFDQKVHFYKKWRFLFPSILLVGSFFILWDIYFTSLGVWGFNSDYYATKILSLPIGEWMFFFTVPYACIFIYECWIAYFPKDYLAKHDKKITYSLFFFFLGIGVYNAFQVYTSWTFLLAASFMFFHICYIPNTYRTRFYIAYLISLVPFIIVNGILTGAATKAPVVLYNNDHNLMVWLNTRFITIPFDDFIYSFLLLIMTVTVYETLKKRKA